MFLGQGFGQDSTWKKGRARGRNRLRGQRGQGLPGGNAHSALLLSGGPQGECQVLGVDCLGRGVWANNRLGRVDGRQV